ncbi:immunoglobulin-like domain-containing protein [Alkalihalobacillus sp. 1P02AB]|uniref:immunoglobulin-like domain-containing protein n=1 Tax=Alkalihalobacillus sp. 1P02AB TaxID=3132260 RepID=UPI0039A4D17A
MVYCLRNKGVKIGLSILLVFSMFFSSIPSLLTYANEGNPSVAQDTKGIQSGVLWTDTDGKAITAHAGSVQRMNEAELGIDFTGNGTMSEDVWVWYGEDKTNATRPVDGVRLYLSEDFINWTDMGIVLHTHDKLPTKLNSSETELEYDVDSLEELKEWGNLTESTEDVADSQIKMAKNFLEAYVTEWKDEDNRIAEAYDEEHLKVAFENLYGRYNIVERPKVIYNEQTKKYVMVYHADGPQNINEDLVNWVKRGADPDDIDTGSRYGKAQIGFAESDSPLGPFKLVNAERMNWTEGVTPAHRYGESRDMTVFVDDASGLNDSGVYNAYVVYSSEMNQEMYVSLLNSEYTGPAVEGGDAVPGEHYNYRVLPDKHREAPAIFYFDGYYYMLTSGADGWNSTDVIYYRSESMILPTGEQWEKVGDPFAEQGTKGNDSQPTSIISVDDEKGQFIYMGDRWSVTGNGSAGSDSRYVWLPIQVGSDNTIRIENEDSWDPTNEWLYQKITINTEIPEQVLVGQTPDLPSVVNVTTTKGNTFDTPVTWSYHADSFLELGTVTVEGTFPELNNRVINLKIEAVELVVLGEVELDTDVVLYGNEYFLNTTVQNKSNSTTEVTVRASVPSSWSTEPVTLQLDSQEMQDVAIPVSPPNEGGPHLGSLTVSISIEDNVLEEKRVDFVSVPKAEDLVYALDAGTESSEVFENYTRLSPVDLYVEENGFGWKGTAPDSRDRGGVDALRRDFIANFNPATLVLDIPAGEHLVYVLSGDRQYSQSNTAVAVNGEKVAETRGTAEAEFKVLTFALDGGEEGESFDIGFSGVQGNHWVFNAAMVMPFEGDLLEYAANQIDYKDFLNRNDSKEEIRTDLAFPHLGPYGMNLTWDSSHPEIISNEGAVNRPSYSEENQDVVVTLTISDGSKSVTREFTFTVLKYDSRDDDLSTIVIDGNDIDEYNRFKGFGTVTANNTSRLMMDYKEEHPSAYWEIMNKLFNPKTGAGLTHVKVELGADVDSSSGTEPATMRYSDEPANVIRGAGFQFAADAKSINPNITTEILRWGEPRWTWEGAANQEYEARYQWYKQTMDAVYEEYGFQLDYVGISQNERAQNNGRNELEWLKYFTTTIKEEPNYEADYQDIKLVGGDGYRDTQTIAQTLLDHPDLIDEIDVIATHYGLTGSNALTELQNKLIAEGKQPKEVWSSEGVSPMINARYRINMEPHYQGLGGQYGIVDVTSRIISMYTWEGAGENPLNAVSFDFQPSVGAFYQGSSYSPKHLISAFTPWNGHYEVDGGILGVRHVMNFVGYNDVSTTENERWQYIKGATYSDGNFMDGGVDVDTSTHNYMTLKDSITDDYTTIFANNTRDVRHYTIQTENLNGKENAEVYVWETRGPDEGQAYDANWFQNVNVITPVDGQYQIEVKPYSIVTISTLDRASEIEGFEYESNPVDLTEDTILPLPYTDDFEYGNYGVDENGRDYIERRGGTPRYTTDQRGAFEVVREATKPLNQGSAERIEREIPEAETRGNLLQQKITPDIIGADWAVWGGTDGSANNSNPHTNFGDYRWVNYKVSYDFLLDSHTPEVSGRSNYALIGVRHVKAGGNDSHAPYNARVYLDGTYEILRLGTVVEHGMIDDFDHTVWNHLAFEARENVFTLYLNEEKIASYTDVDATVMSGRAVIGSGYYETLFDNLRVDPIEGYSYKSEKYSSSQGKLYESEEDALKNTDTMNPIGYVGDWNYARVGYGHYNRSQMSTSTDYPVSSLVSVWFDDVSEGLRTQQIRPNDIVKVQDDESLIGDEKNTVYAFRKNNQWGSQDSNAWANFNDDPYILINFTGTGIDYLSGTGDQTAYHFELNGEDVGNHTVDTNTGIRFSIRDLEEGDHILKVSLGDNERKEDFMDFREVRIYSEGEADTLHQVVYSGDWNSNHLHAWGEEASSFNIKFEGTEIKLFGITGPSHGSANIYLNGEFVGEANYLNNSEVNQVVWSIADLEDKEHTIEVVAQDGSISFHKAEISNSTEVNVNPGSGDSSMIFHFEGEGFNLFGSTPAAMIDVYIDDELVDGNYRVNPKGQRETSYYIRGLENEEHTAKIIVKGGTFHLEGMDVIKGLGEPGDGDGEPGDGDGEPGDGDGEPGDGDGEPGDGDGEPGDGDGEPGDGDGEPGDGDGEPGDGDGEPGDGDGEPGDGDGKPGDGDDKPGDVDGKPGDGDGKPGDGDDKPGDVDGKPGDGDGKPGDGDDKPGDVDGKPGDGGKLPNTATNVFNWLLVGFIMLLVGIGFKVYLRRKSI